MKKILFMALGAGLLLTSCQSDEPFAPGEGGEKQVSFTLSVPETMGTRAESGNNSAVGGVTNNQGSTIYYTLALYNGETLETQLTEEATARTVEFNPTVILGRNYTVVAYANLAGEKKGLTEIGVTKIFNDEGKDAYFVNEDKIFTEGDLTQNLTLTRPFGKLRLVATDYAELNGKNAEIANVEVNYANELYTLFNAKNGEFSTTAANSYTWTWADTYYTDAEGEKTIFADYIPVPAEGEYACPFTITVNYKSGETFTREFTQDIPVKRNGLTTLKGDFFTANATISVTVEDDFDGDYNEMLACYITNLRTKEVYQSFAEAYKNSVNGDELQLSAGKLDMGVHGINGRSLKIYGPNKGVPANGNRQPEAVIVGNVYQPWTSITATKKFEVEFDGVEMAENFYVDVEGGITNLTIKNSIVKSTTAKIANKENRIVYIHAKSRPSTVLLENNLFVGKGAGDDRLEIWMYGDKGDKLGIGSSVNAIIRNNVFDNTVLNLGGDMAKSSFAVYNNTYLNDSEYWLNGAEKEETGVVINLTKDVIYNTFADAYKAASNGDELELSAGKFDLGEHGISGRSLKIYGPNKGVPANGNRKPEAVIVGNVYQPWAAITATNKFEVEFDGVEMAENFYVEVEGGITNLTIKNSIVKSTTAKIANKENRIVYIHAKCRPSTVVLENNLFEGKGTGDDRLEIWMYGDKGDKLGIGSSVTATIKNNVFDNAVLNLGGDLTKSSFDISGNTYQNGSEYWMNGALQENK